MKYAICKIRGKQYKILEGEEVDIEKIKRKEGDKLRIDEVLLLVDNDKILIGQPFVRGASVSYKIVSQIKGEKIRVAKFKAKSRYRRVKGHRQKLTRIKVLKISKSTK